jgi:hypothetical protein
MFFSFKPRGYKREFNPFNLKEDTENGKFNIKFERLQRGIKIKPIWWLLIVLTLTLYVFWYLNAKF